MAANLFGRYVWLIDTLRRYKRLTFQEISELWQESGLGYGEELPLKTFHNHKKAINSEERTFTARSRIVLAGGGVVATRHYEENRFAS